MPSDPDFPSAAEMGVIYWLSLIVAVAIGLGTLIWSFKVDSLDTAIALRVVGVISLIIAVLIFVGQKLVSFFGAELRERFDCALFFAIYSDFSLSLQSLRLVDRA